MFNTMPVRAIRRATFASRMVAVEVSSGAIEIYRTDDDGIEMFCGYVNDSRLTAACRIQAIEALCAAPHFKSWRGAA